MNTKSNYQQWLDRVTRANHDPTKEEDDLDTPVKFEAMIDIETLGTGPRSICLSIGAVRFNNDGPLDAGIHLALEIDAQIAMGCDGDESTLLWWMDQSPEARAKAFTRGRMTLPNAYGVLKRYLDGVELFWAKGPQFDFVILENLLRGAQPLWKYNAVRDVRTMQAEAGLDKWVPPGWEGTSHDPVSDCMFQIAVVREARRRMAQGLADPALIMPTA